MDENQNTQASTLNKLRDELVTSGKKVIANTKRYALITAGAILALSYLIISFVALTFNLAKWGWGGRLGFILIALSLSIFAGMILIKRYMNVKRKMEMVDLLLKVLNPFTKDGGSIQIPNSQSFKDTLNDLLRDSGIKMKKKDRDNS